MKFNHKPTAVLCLLTIIALLNLVRNNVLVNARSVDIIQVLASGACLGAVITAAILSRKYAYLLQHHDNKKTTKRKAAVAVLLLVTALGALSRSNAITSFRAVDLLQLVATGLLLGAILTNIILARKIVSRAGESGA